jgi:diguanylate cyclase (GGDEF)-like protein
MLILGRLLVVKDGIHESQKNNLSIAWHLFFYVLGTGVILYITIILLLLPFYALFIPVAIIIFIIIFILSFLVKGLIERLVSSRLKKLIKVIQDAEQGSFLVRAKVGRNDEIGQVILGFNQLLGVITQIEARHLEKQHCFEEAQVQKNMRIKLEETLFQLERSNERLKNKVLAQEVLMEAAHRLGGTLESEAIVERLIGLLQEKLAWPQFAIFLIDRKHGEKQILKLAASYGFSKEGLVQNAKFDIGEGVIGIVAQTGAPVVISNLEKEKRFKLWEYQDESLMSPWIKKHGSLMAIPMLHKGRVIGVFLICHSITNAFDTDDVNLISALGAQTALAIINAELYEKTLLLATSDPLTGVLNRRAMVKQIEFELARAQRFNTKLALLLIDVDHFKAYNDRMGHVLGDVALKEVAKTLKENIRKVDTLARFGGEEFCVILPQSDVNAAREVANKLCESIRGLNLRGGEKQELGHLSVSIGIAVVCGSDLELDQENAVTDIIVLADQALYEAKRLGRDRFIDFCS